MAEYQNKLVIKLFGFLKENKISVPRFELLSGIPKDRVYKWKQQGTNPKAEDEKIIMSWLANPNLDKVPRGRATAAQKSIRKPKIETDEDADGITIIPISAQGGYSKRYMDQVFQSSLKKLYMPGFPYRGDRYRLWEVEGNSMEPTFKEHLHVLTEVVEPDQWGQLKDNSAYVVVTVDSPYLKWVVKKSKTEWFMISENEELYPRWLQPVKDVKELWLVKKRWNGKQYRQKSSR